MYRGSRFVSDLWNIIINTIKVNVIDGVPFELLECHRGKQCFLVAGVYSLWSDFSHRLSALFIVVFIGLLLPAVLTVVLLGFDAPKIKATVLADTFYECILHRRARIIVKNAPRKFRTDMFWKKVTFQCDILE